MNSIIKIDIDQIFGHFPLTELEKILAFLNKLPNTEVAPETFDQLDEKLKQIREINYQSYFKQIQQAELIKIFPEAKQYIKDKIKQLTGEKTKILEEFRTQIKNPNLNIFECCVLMRTFENEINRLNHEIRRLNGYIIEGTTDSPKINFTQQDIEWVKAQTPILELFQEFFPDTHIRRYGTNTVCCCPFHPDKKPSFYINLELGLFHCFGCNVGGDVIKLVMIVKNLSFKKSIEYLRRRLNNEKG
ncbi:MAG TPA: CHC2 zinc finger domain-containing protein [Candidatus Paceibacterota bacterium]|nr:CHC2 zinc finger domain-containing protein [Candidatus Paceibacterota bacterium]